MRGKLLFLGGVAAGFVLGARAGREKYEELKQTAQKVKENPSVQEAAGVVQEQATRIYSTGKDKLSNSRLAETNFGQRLLSTSETDTGATSIERDPLSDTLATSSSTSSTTGTNSTGSTTTYPSTGSSTTSY
ncbi:MAG TPA: hypothetical protein VK453_25875 [Micromonosporaceae bacterium]|nr:hypothetical protein [Micromonosporaceae bacterium]